ncbi:MAG: hypothetical protein JWM31_384, partial [Solirubrobacterales bacterium]|nr:hypothetical protein [Solirubrobacterales bacterium]
MPQPRPPAPATARTVRRLRARAVPGPVTEVTEEFVAALHALLTQQVERLPHFRDLVQQGHGDDIVQEALLAVTGRIASGHPIDEPFSYARRCAENLANHHYRRRAREATVSEAVLERRGPVVEDVAEIAQQRATMREVLDMVRAVQGVVAELDSFDLELVRAELARADQKQLATRLGVSRPTLYRRKGPAIEAFVRAVAERVGTTPCPEYTGSLLAAAGASNFAGARAAAGHASECSECAATIRHLEAARHGLAIIAPLPPLVAHAAGGDPARGLERLHAAVETAADWVRALILRIGDPTPVGGSATKTVALVAAACTGGGGIYCAVDGVPAPLKAPFTHHTAAPKRASTPARTPAPAPSGAVIPVVLRLPQAVTTARVEGLQDGGRRLIAAREHAARTDARAE